MILFSIMAHCLTICLTEGYWLSFFFRSPTNQNTRLSSEKSGQSKLLLLPYFSGSKSRGTAWLRFLRPYTHQKSRHSIDRWWWIAVLSWARTPCHSHFSWTTTTAPWSCAPCRQIHVDITDHIVCKRQQHLIVWALQLGGFNARGAIWHATASAGMYATGAAAWWSMVMCCSIN